MKKILCVFGSLERAGAQLRTLEVCRALYQRHSASFDFCALGLGPIQLREEVASVGGSIYPISLHSPRFIRQFSALLSAQRYDIVNSFPLLWSGIILWLAERSRVPVRIASFRNSLGRARGLLTNRAFVWLMRGLIRRSATHVVAVSNAAMASMFPPPWQSSKYCQVIYNGLTPSSFQGVARRRQVRAEFGWPDDSRIVISVARFSPQKNHRTILETTRLAYARCKKIRLLLVGGGKPSDEIAKLVDAYGLRDMCVLAGGRTDVPELLRAADVFIFPSLWEGLPGALLEALASGLPAVTSDILPVQEVAAHFPPGMIYMAPANDTTKHAENVLWALHTPIDRAAAQKHFAEQTPFVLERSVKAYGGLYGLTSISPN
jgi:glycosyltransferase involved in cell wall biosynthesis